MLPEVWYGGAKEEEDVMVLTMSDDVVADAVADPYPVVAAVPIMLMVRMASNHSASPSVAATEVVVDVVAAAGLSVVCCVKT